MPLLKKPDLDSADLRSYRPTSNLSVVSKLRERIIFRQLCSYLSAADLLPRLQYMHSLSDSSLYEKALLKVLTEILYVVDNGDLSVLDLPAALSMMIPPTTTFC